MRILSLAALLLSVTVVGCGPSNTQGSSSGTTPTSGSSGGGGGGGGGGGTGPLAGLESAPFVNEVWVSQEGAQLPMIFYPQQNVRVSSTCRQAAGTLGCDALRQIRQGMPVEIPKRSLTGNMSAGTRACTKLGKELVSGHNSVGSEDGFCKFGDGSLISTGALEQYGMRIIE